MKFTRLTLCAAVAVSTSVSAFVIPSRQNVAIQRQQGSPVFMALEDLEMKLLGKTPEPPKSSKAPAPKPKPESKPEPKVVTKAETKPEPKKAPKAVSKPAPVPVVVNAPPPVKPTPKAVVPPPKPAAVQTGDDLTLVKGIAAGTAPLALGALGVLAVGRDFLTKTAARREEIQNKIDAQEAERAAKAKIGAEVDGDSLFGAVGFLGAAGASLLLLVANPFAGGPSFDLPSLPSISTTSSIIGSKKVSEIKPASPSDDARAKIRAAQIERMAAKRAEQEAKQSATTSTPTRAQKKAAGSASDDLSYESLFSKATSAGLKKTSESPEEKKVQKAEKVAITKATLAEGEAKKALEEAKVKSAVTETAKADLAKAEKQEKADLEKAAKAAAKAEADAKTAAQLEKKAIERKDGEAAEKAAELEVKSKMEADSAAKKAKEDAIIEAKAAEKAAVAEREEAAAIAKAKAAAENAAAAEKQVEAEVVKAAAPAPAPASAPAVSPATDDVTPSGGRVLPKEEVSDDVKAFLKTLKK